MQIDNFVLNDTNIVPKKLIKLIAIDAAFIRGGQLADVPQKLAEGKYIDIKYIGGVTDDPGYREGLIKFDIFKFFYNGKKKYCNIEKDAPISKWDS